MQAAAAFTPPPPNPLLPKKLLVIFMPVSWGWKFGAVGNASVTSGGVEGLGGIAGEDREVWLVGLAGFWIPLWELQRRGGSREGEGEGGWLRAEEK